MRGKLNRGLKLAPFNIARTCGISALNAAPNRRRGGRRTKMPSAPAVASAAAHHARKRIHAIAGASSLVAEITSARRGIFTQASFDLFGEGAAYIAYLRRPAAATQHM